MKNARPRGPGVFSCIASLEHAKRRVLKPVSSLLGRTDDSPFKCTFKFPFTPPQSYVRRHIKTIKIDNSVDFRRKIYQHLAKDLMVDWLIAHRRNNNRICIFTTKESIKSVGQGCVVWILLRVKYNRLDRTREWSRFAMELASKRSHVGDTAQVSAMPIQGVRRHELAPSRRSTLKTSDYRRGRSSHLFKRNSVIRGIAFR